MEIKRVNKKLEGGGICMEGFLYRNKVGFLLQLSGERE